MKKLSEIYKEQGIDFEFPIEIKNSNGNRTYYESTIYWSRHEYDVNGNKTYFENSNGYWRKHEFDSDGNVTYYENSNGYWWKHEYDVNGKETYFESSNGIRRGTPRSQSCDGKIVEIDGKKYKLTEL